MPHLYSAGNCAHPQLPISAGKQVQEAFHRIGYSWQNMNRLIVISRD
jgi:hypothetical protein